MSNKPINISVVLPCYNPPEGWEKVVVDSINSIKEKTKGAVELIIVNDGSTKGVDLEKITYIDRNLKDFRTVDYKENRGKGYALRKGVEQVSFDHIIYTDIDFPYTEDSFLSVYRGLALGHEVVLGHRGKNYYRNTPWGRKVISKFLRWTLKTFFRLPTDDSQCGLKGFDKNGAAIFLDTRIDRFLFDMEFIKLAARRKAKIVMVKAELKPDVVFSKVNPAILFREAINFFRVLFRK